MEFVLTMIMCAYVEGKTTCMPPHRIDEMGSALSNLLYG